MAGGPPLLGNGGGLTEMGVAGGDFQWMGLAMRFILSLVSQRRSQHNNTHIRFVHWASATSLYLTTLREDLGPSPVALETASELHLLHANQSATHRDVFTHNFF